MSNVGSPSIIDVAIQEPAIHNNTQTMQKQSEDHATTGHTLTPIRQEKNSAESPETIAISIPASPPEGEEWTTPVTQLILPQQQPISAAGPRLLETIKADPASEATNEHVSLT
jgi:hypothetical protein